MAAMYIVAALALFSTAEAALFGGATSVSAFAADLVSTFKNGAYKPYGSVGSGSGITGLFDGTYKVAASDEPLSNSQFATASGRGGVITAPVVLSTYNFLTKKATGLKLTASTVKTIYTTSTSWSAISGSLSGSIVPYGRADGSGTTKVIDSWLYLTLGSWRQPSSSSWSSYSAVGNHVQFASGTSALLSAVLANSNAIGYAQTGAGLSRGLYETAIRNPAGTYVYASKADPAQSIPRTLPDPEKNWAAVNLLNKSGKTTYPIASFVYTFGLIKGAKTIGREFMKYTQSDYAQGLVNNRYNGELNPVPKKIRTNSVNKGIKKIKN